MTVCARAIQQQDGTLLLALDPANTNLSTCAYVVEDGSSSAWRQLGNMSLNDAQTIGFSVGLLWVGAWAFKMIGRSISSYNHEE